MRDLFTNFYVIWALLASFVLTVVSFDNFNDNILFGVTWAGPLTLREGQVTQDGKDYISSHDSVFIMTNNNEKYRCLLPSEQIKNKLYSGEDGYGPSPEELLAPLADEARCSYRLEAYWTYELCHGKHVRQFHDERTQKGVKLQEYFLGKAYVPDKKDRKVSEPKPIPEPPITNHKDGKNIARKPLTRKLEGRDMPYFEVVMGNGTTCDLLSGKPREIHVLYFCHPQGNNEILSVKEMSTCVYEMEVITPSLCSNEFYRFEEDPVHEISCHSLDGSANQPQSYTQFLEDQDLDRTGERQTILFEQGKPESDEPEPTKPTPVTKPVTPRDQVPLPDDQLTRDFLNGDYCLQGGTGWWKYELCYGKRVLQFHVDEEHGGRTDVLLGKWNKEEHIKWIRSKKTKTVGYAVHLYSGGDICDLTGKPRQVQVRLRCKESTHLQEVSLYLMEPEVCHYILGVESPIICPLLERMDQDGLFH
ncbi:endoplasmic reticulum lectin 1-like isoform X2 [Actinia tenebrosa]|uniref:Endoplasmic reticulum lectin 1 n=1 Tax=Actinia tenebrosa TaxID=6105 RepID=A0A6P8HJS4_ACTTE|nr:endoplasmic reticulum lectin 1-like isoform X2 [Actinia tenebrosa]